MLRNLQNLSTFQRRLIFFLVFGGILLALLAITALLVLNTLNQRGQSVALAQGVSVAQFAALPDADAYPAAVAVAPDGTIYTGSYATGAVWAIDSAGVPTELAASRDEIGSVTGLTVAPDGTIFVADRLDFNPRVQGGVLRQMNADGSIVDFARIDDERGFLAPDDITLDSKGYVYVSDRGRDEVWRFDPDGSNGVAWWTPPEIEGVDNHEPTGLAYDPATDSIIITDPETNTIYRAMLSDGSTQTLYTHGDQPNAPGFDGVTVTPNGVVYVAALGQNGIARLHDGKLEYIAGLFRGASDVDFAAPDKLYVTNFDQFSLVVSAVRPQLPFAIDVLTLAE